jgi:hypothetical protein
MDPTVENSAEDSEPEPPPVLIEVPYTVYQI